jgi:hypothetical protein
MEGIPLHIPSIPVKFPSPWCSFAPLLHTPLLPTDRKTPVYPTSVTHPLTHSGWMVSPGQNIYHATKHFVRAFSEALSIELRAYPGVHNTQLMPGPVDTQFITRGQATELFMFAASGAVEDPKTVAMAGYKGMCKGRRMVYSSYNAGIMAFFMQVAPRCVHVTMGSLMNSPLRGLARAKEPEKDQGARGSQL